MLDRLKTSKVGDWKAVLEEKGCFAIVLPIVTITSAIQTMVFTFTWDFIGQMGGGGPTGLACTLITRDQAEILAGQHLICGIFRGLGGQLEELNLRLKVAGDYFGKRVPSFAILGRFVTGYGSGAQSSWMPQYGGILVGHPSVSAVWGVALDRVYPGPISRGLSALNSMMECRYFMQPNLEVKPY